MTENEWRTICAEIIAGWPQAADYDDATFAVWGSDVADLEAGTVHAALRSIRRTGKEFPPNGGQLRAEVERLTGSGAAGDPDRAWALVQEAIRRHGGDVGVYRGDKADALPASVEREQWLEARDPKAAEAARLVGWDFLRGTGPDEYHEPSVRRAFRESYTAETRRDHTRRQVADLGVGTAPRRIGDVIAGALQATNNGGETR